jgi:hypothetical protein
MFENYKELSADEKAQVKKIHKCVRGEAHSRSGNLAWGFIRGFPYRRIERKTRTQVMGDGTVVHHNAPSIIGIARILAAHIPGWEAANMSGKYQVKPECALNAWLKDESGAIPAPAPREKKAYVRPVESVA